MPETLGLTGRVTGQKLLQRACTYDLHPTAMQLCFCFCLEPVKTII